MSFYKPWQNLVVFLILALFQTACGPHATETSPEEISPVVIIHSERSNAVELEFYCNGKKSCYPSGRLPDSFDWFSTAFLSPDGSLRIPVRTRDTGTANRIGYLLITQAGQKLIATTVEALHWSMEIADVLFIENTMVFKIERDALVYVLKQDGSVDTISLGNVGRFSDFRIKKGNGNSLIAFDTHAKNENGGTLVDVRLVDLASGNVTAMSISGPEEMLPTPGQTGPAKHEPGKKYNILFDGIRNDLRMIYYRYFALDERMQLVEQFNVYDSTSGEDQGSHTVRCIGAGITKDYKGFLYRSGHSATGEINNTNAFLLRIPDLIPLVDLQEADEKSGITRIVPFGDSFLIGLDTKILTVDFRGKIVGEITLPPEIASGNYVLAQYQFDPS